MPNADRRSYDSGASQEVQGTLGTVISQLEGLITRRDGDVKHAMAEFQADGVSDQYHGKEVRWNSAAHEVRSIITLLKATMRENDGTAQSTLSRARGAVEGI